MATTFTYVTTTGGGAHDGSTWDDGFDIDEWEIFMEATVLAGNVSYMRGGSYSTSGDINFSARDGDITDPIALIGVKSGTTNEGTSIVQSDLAIDIADMPTIAMGSFKITTGDVFHISGIDLTGSGTHTLNCAAECFVENCKILNDSGTSGRDGINTSTGSRVLRCDIQSDSGYGINASSGLYAYNYIHDCISSGFGAMDLLSNSPCIIFNIFDTCAIGIDSTSRDFIPLINNTFYECDVAVNETNGDTWTSINNILEGSNTSGFTWTTQRNSNRYYNNHGDNARNTDMWVNVDITGPYQDYNVTTGNPNFTNPGSGDFSLNTATSPNIDAGYGIIRGVG